MLVKNAELVSIVNSLDYFANKKLPQKISYAITRNIMIVADNYSCYEKCLNNIFNEYKDKMIKDSNGSVARYDNGIPKVVDEVDKIYKKEISDLLSIEIDVDFYYIQRDEFNYSDDIGRYDVMSAKDIMALQSIICK